MYGAENVAALSFPSRFELVRSSQRVSIIIPTRDRIDLLSQCLETLYATSGDGGFEVLVLDNGSVRAESQRWLTAAPQRFRNLRVVPADYPFNWSRLNNHGASMATGEVMLFLNNDVEALTPNWLARLSAQATRHDVGAVGALLLYPGGDIQHAGIVIGIGGFADHVYSGVPPIEDDVHRFVSPLLPRNVLACTGACLAIERRKLEEVNGFDERLRICGDVDINLRLIELGYQNVYDSTVKLIHHESATRSRAPLPDEELAQVLPICARYLRNGDPYYNPNFSMWLRYPALASAADVKATADAVASTTIPDRIRVGSDV
jgi:GT2 family glycosyltransferase